MTRRTQGRIPPLPLRYLRLSRTERACSHEALRALLRASIHVHLSGWSRYAQRLGTAHPGDATWTWQGDIAQARAVGRAVERWRRLAPRVATCLVGAIAGQRMLARRGIPSSLVLGLRRGARTEELGAHGWLRVGDEVIIGRREMAGHHPIAHFTVSGSSVIEDRKRWGSGTIR
jgi:hypothetical protein